MNIVLLGPPGSGKGTQGALLSDRVGVPCVSTGDLLRRAVAEDTTLGKQAQVYMQKGELVPDDVILGLIEQVLSSSEAERGIIMDGFPRTVAQAEAVDHLLARRGETVHRVLSLVVPESELVRRLLGRARKEGRDDDTEEAIQQRLAVYREQTEPLIAYYRDQGVLVAVPGTGSIEAIAERMQEALTA